MKIKLITHPSCIYKPKAVLQLAYLCPISLTSTLSWQMLLVHWATHYKNMLTQWLASLILCHQTALLSCPGFLLLCPLPKMIRSILSGEQVNMSRAHYFRTQFLVTLGENEIEDFWEWKGEVWSDQAYLTVKDFTCGGGPVNLCGNFYLHQTGSIYVLLILFGVCFSKQKILSTCV